MKPCYPSQAASKWLGSGIHAYCVVAIFLSTPELARAHGRREPHDKPLKYAAKPNTTCEVRVTPLRERIGLRLGVYVAARPSSLAHYLKRAHACDKALGEPLKYAAKPLKYPCA